MAKTKPAKEKGEPKNKTNDRSFQQGENAMATSHYDYNHNAQPGSEMHNCLVQLGDAWERFTRLRGVLITKKVIGASGDAEFAEIATQYGYSGSDVAADSFGEIDSAFGNGDAAISQMLNRHL